MKPIKKMMMAVAWGCLISITPAVCNAQYWQFTPPADHHKAAVKITCNGAVTSGALVKDGELMGVLTCAHGLSQGKATVTFSDGTKATGEHTTCKYQTDVGFVFVTHPSIPPLYVAPDPPPLGEPCEFITYGGPYGQLRHFTGKVMVANDSITVIDAKVVNGDSGGVIINSGRQVVGVQSTGRGHPIAETTNGWPVFARSGSAPFTPIRNFLSRVRDKVTGGCRIINGQWVCPDQRGFQPWGPQAHGQPRRIDPGNLYPDGGGGQAPPPQGQAGCNCPQGIQGCNCSPGNSGGGDIAIDYEKVANIVYQRVEANADRFRGPPGERGPPGQSIKGDRGEPGKNAQVNIDQLSTVVAKKLPPITVEIEKANGSTDIQEVTPGGVIRIPREAVMFDIVPRGGAR